jgi:hypothetical protein
MASFRVEGESSNQVLRFLPYKALLLKKA